MRAGRVAPVDGEVVMPDAGDRTPEPRFEPLPGRHEGSGRILGPDGRVHAELPSLAGHHTKEIPIGGAARDIRLAVVAIERHGGRTQENVERAADVETSLPIAPPGEL